MADDLEMMNHLVKKKLHISDGAITELPTVTMHEGGAVPKKLEWNMLSETRVSTGTAFGTIRATIGWTMTLEWVGESLFVLSVVTWLEPIGDTDICSSCGDGGLPQLTPKEHMYTYTNCPSYEHVVHFVAGMLDKVVSAAKKIQRSIAKVYELLVECGGPEQICQLSLGDLAEFIPGRASEKAERPAAPGASGSKDGGGLLSGGLEEFVAAAVADGEPPSKDVPIEVPADIVPVATEPPVVTAEEVEHVSST